MRRWLTLTSGWIWGAVVALTPPFVATVLFDEFGVPLGGIAADWHIGFVAAVGGLAGLFLQARVLRLYTSRAYWWIPAVAISIGLTVLATDLIGLAAGGLVVGAVSGGLLIWILKVPPRLQAAVQTTQ